MTTCATCGHEQGGGRFCANCGSPVTEPDAAVTATTYLPPVEPEPALAPAPPPSDGIPRWLPWLLGWLLLAVVAAMVGWAFGSGGDDERSPSSATTGPGSPAPAGTGLPADPAAPADPADVTTSATVVVPETAPPNRSVDGEAVSYDGGLMLDGDPSTAWRMSGDGTGAVLTFTLAEATRLSSVGLVNGYAKVDGDVDWYPRNRRISAVTWGFDDGSTLQQDLIDNPALQTIGLEGGVVTSTVTLTLTTVSAPGAEGGRDFTPVSDVRLIGTPP